MLNYQQARQHHLGQTRKPSPARGPQILVIGFAVIILIGTLLLMLPQASTMERSLTWDEAMFTATSAVTVTGRGSFTHL